MMTIGSFCGSILIGLPIKGTAFSTTDGEGLHNSKKGVRIGRRTIGGADFIDGTADKSTTEDAALFDDTIEEFATYEYGVPEDLEPGDIALVLAWTSSSATTIERVSLLIDIASKGINDNFFRDFTASKSLENRNGSVILHVDEFPVAFAGIVPGEIIGVKITRRALDTIDDLTGDFSIHSVSLRYVRRG